MANLDQLQNSPFNIVEASISDHLTALSSGQATCVDLVVSYLNRIATYDIVGGLNAFTVFNHNVFKEAEASDLRRAQGLPPRPLEGIPYTIKDSYKVAGLSVTDGSPALEGLMSNEDSAIASKLREAGAVLIGKTNMPPMAAGGMQRGMYGRAESPYNSKYLTAAFSSGSSNGAATSIASSMAVFGMGSETVSSGRSPASNNALVCYTPSKGVLSCRGLWPLYVTCDVPAPYARSIDDMLALLNVIATPESDNRGDFMREQKFVPIPENPKIDYTTLRDTNALQGKRVGVPKMYVGQKDSDPHAKHPYVCDEVIELWTRAAQDLETLGAEVIYTDFPLITNYENDSLSGEANNVSGRPGDWNLLERSTLIAMAWNEFLVQNGDADIPSLKHIADSGMLFPKPPDYLPDTFLEVRNWIDYPGLPALLDKVSVKSIHDVPGMQQALLALEAQRKRDLEDWMDEHGLDVLAFPAQGDVGLADLETSLDSATHSLRNGVKYSNGNRAIRHLGVPTVSVPMGVMSSKRMPVNVTFAGKAYEDVTVLRCAYAFEQRGSLEGKRVAPPLAPGLETDVVHPSSLQSGVRNGNIHLHAGLTTTLLPDGELELLVGGTISVDFDDQRIAIYVDGKMMYDEANKTEGWRVRLKYKPQRKEGCLGWDLKEMKKKKVCVVVVARGGGKVQGQLLWGAVE